MTSVVGTSILTVAAGDEDPHRSKFWEIWLASIAVYDKVLHKCVALWVVGNHIDFVNV